MVARRVSFVNRRAAGQVPAEGGKGGMFRDIDSISNWTIYQGPSTRRLF